MASYAERRAASLARPPIDLRPLMRGAIPDQGPRPLCLPLSVSGAHEATRAHHFAAAPEPLAPEPLWAHCVRSGQVSPLGTTMAAVGGALADRGQPTLAVWPYSPTLARKTEEPPAATVNTAWYTAEVIELPLAHDGIEDPLEDALAASALVVVIVEVTREFESADRSGQISVPPVDSPAGDYHAVLAVGAATDAETRVRRLLVHNTWGVGWGAGGYGWLPLDYLIAFAVQAGTVDPTSLRASTMQVPRVHTLDTSEAAMASVVDPPATRERKGA